MDAKKPKGKRSFWEGSSRMVVLGLLLVMVLTGWIGEAFGAATITVKLTDLPGTLDLFLITARAVEAETGELLASVSLTRKSSQMQLKAKAVPQIVFVDLFTSDGNTLSGHTHVLRPADRKKMTVTLQLIPITFGAVSEATDLSGDLFSTFPAASGAQSDISLVGLPSSGFTVEGLDLSARDVAGTLTTTLTSTPCYDQTGGYSVVLTDPGDLAIVNAEIDLSNSTWSDPSTRLQNLYVPPTYFINGSWVSDGVTVTVTYRLVDSQGNELQSKSDTGPVDNLLNIHANVAKALAKSMCCNKSSKVKCAKTGSINVNFTLYQSSYDCVCTFREVGSILISLQSANTDPNAACEYLGEGEASLTIECPGCWCPSTVCPVAISASGKVVSQSGFPCTGTTLTLELWNTFGCNSLCWGTTTITETNVFLYKEGSIVSWPGIIGGYTLHLK
jgi:hypothetical protein